MAQLKVLTLASIPISTKYLAIGNKGFANGLYCIIPGIVLLEEAQKIIISSSLSY